MRTPITPAAIDQLCCPGKMPQDLARCPKLPPRTLRRAQQLAVIAGKTA